ncbi:MAG: hypothetical protein AAF078_07010, partial [Planctomycetota bacterium]
DKRPRVIGDAKGARATTLLATDPTFLPRLREAVGVPIRVIVHLRNPFDIVGSRVKRRGAKLDEAIDRIERLHGELVAAIGRLREDERLIQYHEDVVAEPAAAFRTMFEFLGVEPDERAVAACAAKLWQKPRAARKQAAWSDEATDRLRGLIRQSPIFGPYDEPARPEAVEVTAGEGADATASVSERASGDDRSGVFDRVERFALLLSPHARGVTRLAATLAQHADALLAGELIDDLYEVGYVRETYSASQLMAVVRHAHFLRAARDLRAEGDERRSVKVYRELAERRPTVVGVAPAGASLRALAARPEVVDALKRRVGRPMRAVVFTAKRGQDGGGDVRRVREAFADDEVMALSVEQMRDDPAGAFAELYTFLGVEPREAAVAGCVEAFEAAPASFAEDQPAWVKPAVWAKRRFPGLVDRARQWR